MKVVLAALGFVAAVALAPPAAADDGVFFVTPDNAISCEIDWQRQGLPNQAYCQTFSPPQTVTLDDSGLIKSCMDVQHPDYSSGCNQGDPGDAPTLAYGQSNSAGPFTCRSETSGVTCTIPGGRGFTISAAGVSRVG